MNSPWGQVQHSKEYPQGIAFVETASHGGFYVPAETVAKMPEALRAFVPFAHNTSDPLNECARWYEEDCDWAIVVLAFPELFQLGTVASAVMHVRNMAQWKDATVGPMKAYDKQWHHVREWLRTDQAWDTLSMTSLQRETA